MEELGVKALSILVDNLQKGVDLMPEYVHDLFERYVQYKVYWLSLWMGFTVIALIICLVVAIIWMKDDDEWQAAFWWFWVIIALLVIWLLTYSLFQINFVPELYMIDDIMGYGCNCK